MGNKKIDKKRDVRILVMHRAWAAVGYVRFEDSEEGKVLVMEGGVILRRWGTTKGLGEIAEAGPTRQTVLDPFPTIRAIVGTYIYTMDCSADKWAASLREPS